MGAGALSWDRRPEDFRFAESGVVSLLHAGWFWDHCLLRLQGENSQTRKACWSALCLSLVINLRVLEET